MSIEAVARVGLVAADEKTVEYVKGRPFSPKGAEWDMAVEAWKDLVSDADATFDTVVELDATQIKPQVRSEEHTSELQSLMRISYAVFCLKKKKRDRSTSTKTAEHTTINTQR